MRKIVIDPGHGESTPGKRWTFDDGVEAREYLIVRKFGATLAEILISRGHKVRFTVSDDHDLPLRQRVEIASFWPGSVFVSLHTNAAPTPGVASGFEIWTSHGETVSDKIASAIWNKVNDAGFKCRRQSYNDGDPDFEDNLYVLRKTSGPAVLIELGFHDNRSDVDNILHNESAIYKMCVAIADGLA